MTLYPKPAPATITHRLEEYRNKWAEIGVSTIPLLEDSKQAFLNDWETRPSEAMWDEANGHDFQKNIAVRTGQLSTRDASLVVIDQDNPQARRTVEAKLKSLGLDCATVRTAKKGGRHAYMFVKSVPEGFCWAKLDGGVGAGELRAGSGAYVVAPCSVIGDACYVFMSGNHATLATQPVIEWRDLQWLLPQGDTQKAKIVSHQPATQLETLPVVLQYRPIQPYTIELLEWLKQATKGQSHGHYKTRSEVEAAVVTQLLLCGWELPEVHRCFTKYQPAHFQEAGKYKAQYLAHTFHNQARWLSDVSPLRPALAEEYREAAEITWPRGKTSLTNQKVVMGLIAQCWRLSAKTVYASLRTLAEHANCSHKTVSNALKRLERQGYIRRVKPADKKNRLPAIYTYLNLHAHELHINHRRKGSTGERSCKQLTVNRGESMENTSAANSAPQSAPADTRLASKLSGLWGLRGGLRRSSGMVYRHLSEEPKTPKELGLLSNRHRNTVSTCLAELSQYGLAKQNKEGLYLLGDTSQNEVAHTLGIGILTERKRRTHVQDRLNWNRWMDIKDGQ